MKAKLYEKIDVRTKYVFQVEIDSIELCAEVIVNSNGMFTQQNVSYWDGDLLELEGEEGELHERAIDYIDENWDDLVPMR